MTLFQFDEFALEEKIYKHRRERREMRKKRWEKVKRLSGQGSTLRTLGEFPSSSLSLRLATGSSGRLWSSLIFLEELKKWRPVGSSLLSPCILVKMWCVREGLSFLNFSSHSRVFSCRSSLISLWGTNYTRMEDRVKGDEPVSAPFQRQEDGRKICLHILLSLFSPSYPDL